MKKQKARKGKVKIGKQIVTITYCPTGPLEDSQLMGTNNKAGKVPIGKGSYWYTKRSSSDEQWSTANRLPIIYHSYTILREAECLK